MFAVADQTAATIARLLVKEIVSRHGVPSEILSDRGRAFLSGLMQEVETLLGFRKVNTTAYHPQTDGLVERYNKTLTAMLAKPIGTMERPCKLPLCTCLFCWFVEKHSLSSLEVAPSGTLIINSFLPLLSTVDVYSGQAPGLGHA